MKIVSPVVFAAPTVIQDRPRSRAAGFSLVELMVALVMGLIGMIVMMQMFSVYEEQKRRTTGGDDALSSGTIALNGLQRDIQQAGWGLTDVLSVGCNVSGLVSGGVAVPLIPVSINPRDGAGNLIFSSVDANTDSIMIISGNGNGSVEGELINGLPALGDAVLGAVFPNVYEVQAAGMFTAPPTADRVFAAPATRGIPCNLAMTTIAGINRPNVSVVAGVAGATGGRLFNMGSAPIVRVYAIRNSNLTVCDYIANNCAASVAGMTTAQLDALWVPIANNVVSLRAQYGRDTATAGMDGIVDAWATTIATTTTPVSLTPAKNLQACGILRAPAVRVALVARSAQPEKTLDWPSLNNHVTAATPVWLGSGTTASAFDLPSPSPSWPTWQDFRYKVFQTVIPLRNITSRGVVAEC